MTTAPTPRVSIIIPVYNEEAILQTAVVDLIDNNQSGRVVQIDRNYQETQP